MIQICKKCPFRFICEDNDDLNDQYCAVVEETVFNSWSEQAERLKGVIHEQ